MLYIYDNKKNMHIKYKHLTWNKDKNNKNKTKKNRNMNFKCNINVKAMISRKYTLITEYILMEVYLTTKYTSVKTKRKSITYGIGSKKL